jgi:hypothetical protein
VIFKPLSIMHDPVAPPHLRLAAPNRHRSHHQPSTSNTHTPSLSLFLSVSLTHKHNNTTNTLSLTHTRNTHTTGAVGKPDKCIMTRVTGPEPGYVATPIIFVELGEAWEESLGVGWVNVCVSAC